MIINCKTRMHYGDAFKVAAGVQTGCAECVWDIYSRNLLAYKTARAKQKGEAPPVDAFAAMEKQLYGG